MNVKSWIRRAGAIPLLSCLLMWSAGLVAEEVELSSPQVQSVIDTVCKTPFTDVQRLRSSFEQVRIVRHDVLPPDRPPARTASELLFTSGEQLIVEVTFPGNRLRRIVIEKYDENPVWSVRASGACDINEARRIHYNAEGMADFIQILGADLTTEQNRIPLNPNVPIGAPSDGVLVGIIDSGINYTLPNLTANLAYGEDGKLIGYDFWDGDERPFDIDAARSPFFPLHHGSAVSSVLVSEATATRLLPIRYPRPDMTKMADVVEWLAARDVRLVNMAMGSNDRKEWAAFEEAAQRHPEILFIVSAGNNGRDIGQQPIFPAAFGLDNMLVITSSEIDGRLARGSNWNVEHVDLLVPGERLDVIDHRGAPGKASGSSFAVPRVAALAVRILEQEPDLSAQDLKRRLTDRARPAPGRRLVKYGWIPDPTDGP